jgi:hypothetical protein
MSKVKTVAVENFIDSMDKKLPMMANLLNAERDMAIYEAYNVLAIEIVRY